MADDSRLSSSLQESLLTAICFFTDEVNEVLPIITPDLFEGLYHVIAERVLDYRSRFRKCPGEGHIDDLFDDILSDTGHKHHANVQRLLVGMLEQKCNGYDISYVLSRTTEFVRRQTLKRGVMQAAERYQQGGDGVNEDVEKILLETVNSHIKSLDLGVFLGETERVLSFLDRDESEFCKLGIPELDNAGIYPVKKQLFLFLAPYKFGKSWFLTHVGKMALLQGWKVAEVSLEMSEEEKCQRYVQALYSVSRRSEGVRRAVIKTDELGRIVNFEVMLHRAKMSFDNPTTRKRIEQKIHSGSWQHMLNNLVVKEFPSGDTTIRDIELWLDSLEHKYNFKPDLLMLDQPLAMSLGDPRHRRQNLGSIGSGLKGLSTKRDMAVVAPHQVNRVGAAASQTKSIHAAEDISLLHTCDTAITFSQTPAEQKLGLARLFVDSARHERKGFTVLISQSYNSGQFVLESAKITSRYDALLKEHIGEAEEEDDEDDEDC